MNLLLKYIDIIYFYNKRKIIRLKLFEKLSGKSLNDFFKSFCAGKPEMESKQFSKLIKECKLTEKKIRNKCHRYFLCQSKKLQS